MRWKSPTEVIPADLMKVISCGTTFYLITNLR